VEDAWGCSGRDDNGQVRKRTDKANPIRFVRSFAVLSVVIWATHEVNVSMQAKIFITHSWSDIDFVRRLHDDLAAQGLEIWFDDKTLKGGHRLAEEINRGLAWCNIYLPVLSRKALSSNWCWEEINAAIAWSNRARRKTELAIIPVLAEACEDELPPLLAARLYFNFAQRPYEEVFRELLSKGLGLASVEQAKPPSAKKKTPGDARTQAQIARMQAAVRRLAPHLQTIFDTMRKLAEIAKEMEELAGVWRAQGVPPAERVRRLQSIQKLIELMTTASQHCGSLGAFAQYANPTIGIGAGNISEVLKAYKTMTVEFRGQMDWADNLLKATQQQSALPPALARSLMQTIQDVLRAIASVRTEIANPETVSGEQ